MTAFVVLCVALYLFACAVAWIADRAESVEAHVERALAQEADDWAESDTPIYDATAAHIAKYAATSVDDEWAAINDATGGAA